MSAPSFIFGGNTGLSYEQLQKRRQVLEAMQARSSGQVARNTGEGIAQLGEALGRRLQGMALDREETAMEAEQAPLNATLADAQASMLSPVAGPGAGFAGATGPIADATTPAVAPFASDDVKGGIIATAQALGIDPIDLGTAISYETGGTFDPMKKGPTTQWGQHKGLIQFGEPQAKQYGVDWANPVGSQLGPDGAVAKYLRATGVKPGMGMLDIYSAINAGGVGLYNRSDANNGGARGTVRDKVEKQMGGHRAKAMALLAQNSAGGGAAAAIEQAAPVQVASLDPGFMPEAAAPAPAPAAPNVALVSALQARQAVPPMPAPQTVEQNPVPPQDPMAGLDPRTSPEARAAMASGEFDGFAPGGGAQQVAQAMPQPAVPAAPSGAVGQVAGAVQQAAQARGVDPSVLIGIANNPRATDGQRRVAQALLQQQMQQQQAAQQQAYAAQQKQQEYARQDSRFAVTDARDNERLAIERARFEREGGKPIEVGGVLLDPATMKPVYTAPEKPTPDIQEFEFAQRNGYKGDFVQFQLDQKKAGASSTSVSVGGGSDKQVFDAMAESTAAARSANQGLNGLAEAKRALNAGIISGAGADVQLGLQKIGAALGVTDPTTIQNTETFRAAIAPQVAAVMKATVGSANISNSDREFAEKAAGGNINLDAGSIERLIGIMDKAARTAIKSHRDRLEKVYPGSSGFDRERALFDVAEPTALPEALPQGVTEEDIAHTMQVHGLTREQVLERLR